MGVVSRSFQDFLSNGLAIVSTKASQALDTRVGSVIRAIFEAAAVQSVYVQNLVLQVQAIQRAATATGADLDSWLADFSFTRLAATYNTGQATFTRNTVNASSPVVPVGATIQSSLGNVQYTVVADTTNAAYSATLGGYAIPANQASVSASIQAVNAGTASNVLAGALNLMTSPIAGVDTVSNASPINNAKDVESDAAVRVRFAAWISGGIIKGTYAAIVSAITGVQQGLGYLVLENQNFDGSTHNGFFTAIVQDGSGGLTSQEQTNISSAINLARPFTVGFAVQAPTNVTATYTTTSTLPSNASTTDAANAKTAAQNAVSSYINALPIGQNVPIRRLDDVAIDALIAYLSPLGYVTSGITVNGTTLNGASTDLTIAFNAIARAGTITVN